jgi:hypothetical protein
LSLPSALDFRMFALHDASSFTIDANCLFCVFLLSVTIFFERISVMLARVAHFSNHFLFSPVQFLNFLLTISVLLKENSRRYTAVKAVLCVASSNVSVLDFY